MDVQVEMAITQGLRHRSLVVLRAQEDRTDQFTDPDLLDRATVLGYVVFTRDIDFLIEGARRQGTGEAFAGIVYAHQITVSIGRCVQDLELMAKVFDPVDMLNRVVYLPL
jgi:predicted nuclease of predicted toxin-antitoxin system